MKLLISFFIFFSVFTISCKDELISVNEDFSNIQNVEKIDYEFTKLSFEELPYTIVRLADPANNPNPVDENGIEVFILDGVTYYHPLHLCQRIELYVDNYFQTKDTMYLNWIRKYHDKLMEFAVEKGNAIYFPYEFDWKLHGYEWDQMKAPWLSALTQGVALIVHTRLYAFTGEEKYLNLAKKVFNSFNLMPDNDDPWITMIDENNYLWFEEYPDEEDPNFTLNGFIFCIYGLYEYYVLTNDQYAKFLLQATISTVRNYIEDFRVKGDISYYCLKHKAQHWNYHLIHTKQLRTLFHFTGDEYFSAMADSFYNDYRR